MLLQLLKNLSKLKLFTVVVISAIFYILIYVLCQSFLELKAYDFLSNITASDKPSKNIVIVTIDDQSLNKIGRWPWKRSLYTDVFEYFENYGKVKAIAFDSYLFSYSNPKEDLEFFNRAKKLIKLNMGTFYSKQKGFFDLSFENKVHENFEKFNSLDINDKRSKKIIKNSNYYSCSYSLPELVNKNISLGSVLTEPDSDGIIRKFEPIIKYKNNYYPSLSLALYSKINGFKKFNLSNNRLTLIGKNKLNIPLISNKKSSYIYLKWYKNNHYLPYKTYSAWKIIHSFEQIKKGETPLINPNEFKGKTIVFGATSTVLKDIKSTPMGRDYPGVYIQATAINNLMDKKAITHSLLIDVLILLITLIACFIIIFALSPIYSAIIIALISFIYFEICYFSYINNFAIDIVTPPIFAISSMTIGYGVKYLLESRHKKQIQSVMAKYMSNKVMDDIFTNKRTAKLGGKRLEMTVLFADIRNFTQISENIEPEEVSAILNLYFSEMIPIIGRNNGILNKFMGDALLAVFGTEDDNKNHPYEAVKCAYEMIGKVKELQKKWIKEGKPKVEIGIGINTGVAFIGNIGSEERMEYTVIGDTVNLASRLESFNKLYNTKLLISEYTYQRVKTCLDVIKISSVYVKGKSEPLNIYEVIQLISTDKCEC